ncbi:hypothetical protein MAR_007849 [Mya arenaria]|uniref:Secreted protein n=1 Tax=Mya arenaria TaxID=6604 RepID=A0ABY7DYC5_MYAAR|nr:hypothetical protein MAR_007849 [Mya arenaria]
MKLVVTLAFCFIVKVSIGNTVLQSTCQLDLESTVSKSLDLLKNALARGECEPTCPDGWLYNQGSCYLFGNTLLTFEDAKIGAQISLMVDDK